MPSYSYFPQTCEKQYIDRWQRTNKARASYEEIQFNGLTLRLERTVFSPDPLLTHSSLMLAQMLPNLKDKKMLDLGTGCGAIALSALAKPNPAASVVAVDIDSNALHYACLNAKANGFRSRQLDTKRSDLFNALGANKYDLITANLPILPSADGLSLYERLFSQYSDHLNPGGRMLMAYASFGDVKGVEGLMHDNKLAFTKSTTQKFGVGWHLYDIERTGIDLTALQPL